MKNKKRSRTFAQGLFRREKWEVLTGWQVTDANDDTGIEAWNRRRTQIDSKPLEQRKVPPPPWEPFLCQTVQKCNTIEHLESFIQESIADCLKAKPKTRSHKTKEAVTRGGSKVEVYAQVKAEHEKQQRRNKSQEEAARKSENNQGPLEEGEGAKKGRAKTAITAGSTTPTAGEASHDKRCTTAIGIREDKQTASPEGDIPISKSDCRRSAQNEGVEDAHRFRTEKLDSVDSKGNPLKGIPTSSDSSIGAEDKKVPKLSYSQSNIKLRYIHSRHSNSSLGTVQKGRIKDEDEDDFRDFVRTEPRGRGIEIEAGNHMDAGLESDVAHSGLIVTAVGELKERCESRAESMLVDVVPRSRPPTNSDDGGRGKSRTMSAVATLGPSRSAMSHYSAALSEEESRYSPRQSVLDITKEKLDATKDKEAIALAGTGYNVMHKSRALQNGNTSQCSLDLSRLLSGEFENNTKPIAATARESRSGSGLSSHLFPIGDLLPAVDKSLWSNMAGSRSIRLQGPRQDPSGPLGERLGREFTITGKDKLLPYEDTIIMMREGVELVRLRERNQTFLGPPAFRPARARTPLVRGKDTQNKRLFGQFSPSLLQSEQQSEEIGNKTRWQSAAGTIYSRGNTSNADDMKQTPRLSRRRKGPDNTSASAPSLNLGDVRTKLNPRMMDLIR